MMSRKSSAVVGAAFLTVALAVPTMAQEPTVEVLADGLNNPRGVKGADDGSIYVAEAGFGGDTRFVQRHTHKPQVCLIVPICQRFRIHESCSVTLPISIVLQRY